MKDSGEEMKAAYDKLTKDGKTSALHRIPFESGSAEVVASETKKRTELLKRIAPGGQISRRGLCLDGRRREIELRAFLETGFEFRRETGGLRRHG